MGRLCLGVSAGALVGLQKDYRLLGCRTKALDCLGIIKGVTATSSIIE